jgi:hypothetical protein
MSLSTSGAAELRVERLRRAFGVPAEAAPVNSRKIAVEHHWNAVGVANECKAAGYHVVEIWDGHGAGCGYCVTVSREFPASLDMDAVGYAVWGQLEPIADRHEGLLWQVNIYDIDLM